MQREGILRSAVFAAPSASRSCGDRSRRAALSLPRLGARRADQAVPGHHGDRLGAGRAAQHGAAEVHAAAAAGAREPGRSGARRRAPRALEPGRGLPGRAPGGAGPDRGGGVQPVSPAALPCPSAGTLSFSPMATAPALRARQARESVVIRFAGDSGDGMQVTGSRFTVETALAGNDLTTFPDFPAEIRAPAGTTYGVSAFQIQFGAGDIMTPGDAVDVLVAMNPAALKVDLKDLRLGGSILVDTGAFSERNLTKAGFPANPLEDGSLAPYQVLTFDITRLTTEAVKAFGLSTREAHRCRNMWALGLMLWMYGRDRQVTIDWLRRKFADRPELAQANVAALNAGHAFGETAEMSEQLVGYTVPSAPVAPGRYRTVSGTEALAWGLIAGMRGAGLEKMIFAGYPITPASLLLHTLANLKAHGVITFQAEDEIAAIGAAIGAAYAGALGVTSSSGPGMALKTEMLGLAIATELPIRGAFPTRRPCRASPCGSGPTRRASTRCSATRRPWRGRGPYRARRGSSTASAGSRRTTIRGTSPTIPTTTRG